MECISSVPKTQQSSVAHLKKHLLGVFLSASMYSAEATSQFLTEKGLFQGIL
jgi:hypothetical protein